MSQLRAGLEGTFLFLSITAAAFVTYLLMFPSVLLIGAHSKRVISWRRWYCCTLFGTYANFSAAMVQIICGTRIFFYSDSTFEDLASDGDVVVLSNQGGFISMIFAGWCYGAFTGMNEDMRMILHEKFRSIPLYGWTMQLLMYNFFSRDKEMQANIKEMQKKLEYRLKTASTGKTSVLLFPSSPKAAPRPSGFIACVETMRDLDRNDNQHAPSNLCAVHDLTLDFVHSTPSSFNGSNSARISRLQIPQEVHIAIHRCLVRDLPVDRTDLQEWLSNRFARKEGMITNRMQGSQDGGGSSRDDDQTSTPKWPKPLPNGDVIIHKRSSIIKMFSQCFLVVCVLVISSWIRAICTIFIILSIASRLIGGFDGAEFTLHGDMILAPKSPISPDIRDRASTDAMLSTESFLPHLFSSSHSKSE
jgi:hypothetical protein